MKLGMSACKAAIMAARKRTVPVLAGLVVQQEQDEPVLLVVQRVGFAEEEWAGEAKEVYSQLLGPGFGPRGDFAEEWAKKAAEVHSQLLGKHCRDDYRREQSPQPVWIDVPGVLLLDLRVSNVLWI